MSDSLDAFGQRLREARHQKGLKQSELADLLNTSFQTISHWEANRAAPNFAVLCQLADILEVSIDYLAGRVNDPQAGWTAERKAMKYGKCLSLNCSFSLETSTPENYQFCPDCGARLIYDCPKCNTPRELKNQQYCMKCGQLFEWPLSAATPPPPPAPPVKKTEKV